MFECSGTGQNIYLQDLFSLPRVNPLLLYNDLPGLFLLLLLYLIDICFFFYSILDSIWLEQNFDSLPVNFDTFKQILIYDWLELTKTFGYSSPSGNGKNNNNIDYKNRKKQREKKPLWRSVLLWCIPAHILNFDVIFGMFPYMLLTFSYSDFNFTVNI